MIALNSDFYFKGERKYINFPTVFEVFNSILMNIHSKPGRTLFIKTMKIHNAVTCNSLIRVFDTSDLSDGKYKTNLIAEMHCTLGTANYFVGLYDEDRTPVTRRIVFPDKELVGSIQINGAFSGTCDRLVFKDHHELFQAFSTANKELHILSFPKSDTPYEIKAVMLAEYSCPETLPYQEAVLAINHMGLRENPHNIFTLNQLILEFPNGQKNSFQLYYSITKQN